MRDGESVDPMVGLTPLDGLMMGTRGSAIDPGVLLYLQQEPGMSLDDLQQQCSIRIRFARVPPLLPPICGSSSSATIRIAEPPSYSRFGAPQEVAAMAIRWAVWNS